MCHQTCVSFPPPLHYCPLLLTFTCVYESHTVVCVYILFLYAHVYIQVCVYVCVHTRTCACQRSTLVVFPYHPPLFLETWTLTELRGHTLSKAGCSGDARGPPVCASPSLDHRDTLLNTVFLHRSWAPSVGPWGLNCTLPTEPFPQPLLLLFNMF